MRAENIGEYVIVRTPIECITAIGTELLDRTGYRDSVRTADAMRAFLRDADAALERRTLGTSDPELAAKRLEECCSRTLAPVAECLFYRSNVGLVAGLVLVDGRRVVAKVHRPEQTRTRLTTVQRVQGHLAEHGYPCPRPVGMSHCEHAFVTFEELCEDGEYRNGHEPPVRRAMAESLAEQIRLAAAVPEVLALSREPLRGQRVLWRDSHPMFDFAATRAGAEWIDELATRALDVLRDDPGATVVGHTDWRVEQMRFTADRISVAYDWDSLVRDSETTIVGYAARAFPLAWERGGTRLWPAREEQVAFVAEYEAARGRPFSTAERRAVAAAGVFLSPYGARCEHAVAEPGAALFDLLD
jgi:Phosphotransferase enzyme family